MQTDPVVESNHIARFALHRDNSGAPVIIYTTCPHLERHKFCHDSPLLNYLQSHCKGFEEDISGRYTLNYIIVVLLANWFEKELLLHDTIICDPFIQTAFKTENRFLFLSELRGLVVEQTEPLGEHYFSKIWFRRYQTPLWCVYQETAFIDNIFIKAGCPSIGCYWTHNFNYCTKP